ncbi:MAG: sigma-70 family RNA polymerase sigma factor [Elusimicrobia bacterium]|nr:sigma-70 family RNA polymerase sigma factor [Elusimicrobiota bacterium]
MPEEGASDEELIDRVRSGDDRAYAELIRRNHARIFGLCASMLGDRTSAEDAAQEIFLKAYQSLGKFGGKSAFSTWLYRVASNHCLDILRKASRRRAESLDAVLEEEGGRLERLLRAPDEERRAEDADLVERVLATLPPDYRLILTLREVQGLSYEEIMEAMDCSLDSVKARLRRARESLEDSLRHFLGPDDVSSSGG